MMLEEAISAKGFISLRHFMWAGRIRPDGSPGYAIFNHAMEACSGQTEVPQIAICGEPKTGRIRKTMPLPAADFSYPGWVMDKNGAFCQPVPRASWYLPAILWELI